MSDPKLVLCITDAFRRLLRPQHKLLFTVTEKTQVPAHPSISENHKIKLTFGHSVTFRRWSGQLDRTYVFDGPLSCEPSLSLSPTKRIVCILPQMYLHV